ncbi:AQG_2a_G0033230.mRNA.1.CDS.1 [Saccharomyces cerevisiae]|jgi:transcription initiation factor TFIIA small subunit|uniref:Transcription initiation factor IIA subunit 2 n=12 Tax=Saccharomyces TaxID=4930 RepID=T2AG_YEAST|nr:transcription initiation factor IIA subunit gamma [Saccharomyces cerevisiae S288C]P32774.1 RecName: Full=Transcription initiation factor IIA subunit 2; AltName: Full=General transcription factor IIA subunit 2; AltName: Full=TFIIA 13.5 kDa subunit; AltName: Full=Transcription initiation factor IIA small chain; AltName: Full=Transcription initiation factor IIA small subunit [Saccharomyces cerevisiae S288C]1RM1_B Chain B, Transcription initiation factor IIA small chain [Saccharomyces cerevisiae]|eukprot:NP_012865.1 transcription initiation factor IIA subunit gamma [Saccharomyces cerevisiae S288C]
MAVPGYYELYRRSTIGNSLVDALDTLISDGRIEASLAMRVLETFDKVVAETLKDNTQSKLTVKGNLDTYGFCDDVWTFIVKNCQVTVEDSHRDASQNGSGDSQSVISVDKLRIVACNSKKSE